MINITVRHREYRDNEIDIDELVHRLVYIAVKHYADDKIMASKMKDIIEEYL
jgi:hypothetical protein